jgi:hypothetical protein
MKVFLFLIVLSQALLTSDYLLVFLEGAKLNKYIDGSLDCATMMRNAQYDMLALNAYWQKEERPSDPLLLAEENYFNVTGQLVKSMPDLAYFCYDIPTKVRQTWTHRLAEFEDIQDFSDGFFQNILGNMLTISDAVAQIQMASNDQDYEAVVYQIGRLFRRMFDFQPMKSSPLLR